MKAMILAAGYGKRLRPLTWTMPKPMVPLCNRTIIGWIIESYLTAGVRDFIVNLHHLPDVLQRGVTECYGKRASLTFSYEPEILGSGGGVRKVRGLLQSEEEFFLSNGDTVQFAPVDELQRAWRHRDALAALTLRHSPAGDRYTAVWAENGRITGFGRGSGEPLMFSGSQVVSSRVFEFLPDREVSNLVDDVYKPLAEEGQETLAAVVDDAPVWFDIGIPRRYADASRSLLAQIVGGAVAPPGGSAVLSDSLVADSARVSGSVRRSVVGERTNVEGRLDDSVVWDDCRLGRDVDLQSCIVAHGVSLQKAELRNMIICPDDAAIPRDFEARFENGLVLVPF